MLSRRFRQRRDDWVPHGQLRMSAPCPVCASGAEPAVQVGALAVCAHCGGSFVILEDGTARRATGADTLHLSAADLETLRKARKRTR
jgi:hypothetical protein